MATISAIIQFQGKQFQVKPGDVLTLDRVAIEPDKTFSIDTVLLTTDGKTVTVGQPTIEKSKVTLKVLKHLRADKIRVGKFRSKSRYRKVKGHRQSQSEVEVVTIA